MSKELSSRLTSGLVTTIGGPDYHTRIKILEEKAKGYNVLLSKEVLHFLAGRLKRDIRQMESALKCLKARSELVGARIDMDLAKEVVSALVSGEGTINTEKVMRLVCEYYKVDPEMLRSKSRKKVYAYPRNIYAYLCRKYSDETLESIGNTINRSHSTVVYATELVEKKMKTDRSLKISWLCSPNAWMKPAINFRVDGAHPSHRKILSPLRRRHGNFLEGSSASAEKKRAGRYRVWCINTPPQIIRQRKRLTEFRFFEPLPWASSYIHPSVSPFRWF
jgi:hypothetical protein